MLSDLRYAFRQLAKSPGFTAAIILVLALGIGGVTAMFSTLYSVMIRPLPYPKPAELVMGRCTYKGEINPWLSGPDFADYRNQCRSFSALEVFFSAAFEMSVRNEASTERADFLFVSTGLFPTLGVNMARGRTFTTEEGKDGAPPVAIISHAYWQKHFGGARELAGCTLMADGVAYAVVGVAPSDFHFLKEVDIWLPQRPQNLGPRRYFNWLIVGRLKAGVSLAEAQTEVDLVSAQLEKAYPETNINRALLLTPLQGAITEKHRSSVGLLCVGAAAVLLIACGNAAGLLLARGTSRQGELAVRAALGASGWQVMRLLLVEALVLATASGVLGTALALWIQEGLLHLLPVETLLLGNIGLSGPVLLFVLATTLLTGLGFGLIPAWRAKHPDLTTALKSGGRGSTRHGTRWRSSLVVAQLALSFVLLVVAGLLTRSLSSLHQTNPGFDPKNLLTVEIPLPPRDYKGPKRTVFFQSLLENIRALPGVQTAAAISQLPLRNPYNNVGIYEVGSPPIDQSTGLSGNQRIVLPGYFQTMGIPLLAGRDVRDSDTSGTSRVVLVSESLATNLFPGQDPLGRHVVIDGAVKTPWEIIGITGDIKASELREERKERGAFYRPHGQASVPTMRLAIRTSGNPQALVPTLRSLLQRMDSSVPLSGPRTMVEVMANATVAERAQTMCLVAFSLLAVILATVGIFGLLAYNVTQGRRDIGIRLALGANRKTVAWTILRQATLLALVGTGIGAVAALGASHLMRASLFGVGPTDPIVFVLSASVLLGTSAVASWLPARRATRVNPIEALRAE